MVGSFLLIYWLQSLDKNFNKKNFFDKFKIPVLVSAIIGIVSQTISNNNASCSINSIDINQDIFTEVPDF